jgi:hypothetical protein
MGTQSESLDTSSVGMDLCGLRRMKELNVRRRSCEHVVMLFCKQGWRQERRDLFVWRGVKSQ